MPNTKLPSGKITMLFSDMACSTTIARKLGKELFQQQILNPHAALWEEMIVKNKGCIMQYTGDGYLAVFENPHNAIQAAVDVQTRLKTHPIAVEKDGYKAKCVLRLGLHRSLHDMTPNQEGGYDEAYEQIAYAHRVMEPGCDEQILVSETLWEDLSKDGKYPWKAWDNRYLKSFTERPETLHELLWDGGSKGEPGTRWTPIWYVRELNSYIDRLEPMKFIRDWMKESTAGKSSTPTGINKSPLLTIRGFGGMGKTRLAIETVLQTCSLFPGGTAFVRLDVIATTPNPEEATEEMMTRAVATALEAEPTDFKTGKDLVPLLQERTKKGCLLLVLDNWESVKNPQTLQWLEEILVVGKVFCLVTSRTDAGIENVGKTYEIPFMQIPERQDEKFEDYESGRLFIERAQQHLKDWKVTPVNRPRLFEILKGLLGHPLGIELVASHVQDNPTLDEIQTGLRASLLKEQKTREGSSRWDHPRHYSLEASLNWSLERLPEKGRHAFPRVGVIPFDISSDCAKEVCEIDPDWLKDWRRHSLLFLLPDRTMNRYDMLPVVREYCLDQLKLEAEIYRARYEAWCLELAKKWEEDNLETLIGFSNDFRHLLATAERLILSPPTWEIANSLNTLGNALWTVSLGDRNANLRSSIRCYEAALRVRTEQAFPQDWAITQNNLGLAYLFLPSGNRAANLRSAIACYEAALRVYTEHAFPQEWAATQNNLGLAYRNHPSGDRDANHRSAISLFGAALRVYTKHAFPQDWAKTQNNLGNAHQSLPSGDRDANLRSAIACYEASLMVTTDEVFPQYWAAIQNNLGEAFRNLTLGDWEANLRSAIRCYEAALTVRTEQAFPQDWAITQNNLGLAYLFLPSGNRAANLRSAIALFEAALRVYTEKEFPQDWATTQNNLGIAYANFRSRDQESNLRSAIVCFEAALRVRTEQTFPQDWAMTQNNLGNAYSDFPSGDRDANLLSAIRCYEAALRVATEQTFPQDWARTQNNLGSAYQFLHSGDWDANLRSAILCYEAALRVYTEQAFPQDWAMTQQNIAVAYVEMNEMERAKEAVKKAIRGYRSCGVLFRVEPLESWLKANE